MSVVQWVTQRPRAEAFEHGQEGRKHPLSPFTRLPAGLVDATRFRTSDRLSVYWSLPRPCSPPFSRNPGGRRRASNASRSAKSRPLEMFHTGNPGARHLRKGVLFRMHTYRMISRLPFSRPSMSAPGVLTAPQEREDSLSRASPVMQPLRGFLILAPLGGNALHRRVILGIVDGAPRIHVHSVKPLLTRPVPRLAGPPIQ